MMSLLIWFPLSRCTFFGCLILCGIVEQFKDLFYCALYSQSIGKCWIGCRSYFRIHFEVHSTQPQRAIEGGNFSFVTFVQTTPNHRGREEEKTSRLRPVLALDRCEGGYPKRHYFAVKKFSIATWTKMGRRLMLFFLFSSGFWATKVRLCNFTLRSRSSWPKQNFLWCCRNIDVEWMAAE